MDTTKWKRSARVLPLSLALAGCMSVGPDYKAPDSPVPETWRNAPEASSQALSPAPAAWWTVFGDEALDSLVSRVHANNQSLAAAVATMDSYAAQLNMTRAEWGPAVALSGKTGTDRQPEAVHAKTAYPDNPAWLYDAGFSLQWELDLWGRVRRSVEAARGTLEASEQDLLDTRLSLEAQAVSEYIQLRTLQQQIAYAKQNAALQEESVKITHGRFDAGLASELDVHQAEMNLAYTRSTIPPLEAEVAASLGRLSVLAGELPGALDALAEPAPVPSAANLPDAVPADVLRRRPDIRAAERRLAAQTAKIGVAEGDLFPKFSLNGAFSLSTTYSDQFFQEPARGFFLGPAVDWTVFATGRLRNRVKAEEAAARAAAAAYRQTVLAAFAECETAFAAYRGAVQSLEERRRSVEAARKSVELAAHLYKNGLTDFQNVLDMLRQLSGYEDSLAQTQGAVASRLVDLYKAVGGGAAAETAPAAAEEPAAEAAG